MRGPFTPVTRQRRNANQQSLSASAKCAAVRKSDKENTRLAALWIVKHQVNGNRGGYTKVGATIGVDNLNEDKVKYQVKVLRGNSNFMQQLIARVQHERAVEKKVAGKKPKKRSRKDQAAADSSAYMAAAGLIIEKKLSHRAAAKQVSDEFGVVFYQLLPARATKKRRLPKLLPARSWLWRHGNYLLRVLSVVR